MHQKLKQIVLAAVPLLMIAMIVLIASCCDDCPTCPSGSKPYRGYLYAVDSWHDWLYQIDLETDSVIDSITHEVYEYMTGAIDVSNDGRYLAVGYTLINPFVKITRIFDAQNLQMVVELEGGGYPIFSEDADKLIICGDNLRIFSVPDFTIVHQDEIGRSAQPVIAGNDIYFLAMFNWASEDSQYIGKYDYVEQELVDTFVIKDDQNNWFSFHQFDVSSNGRYLYFGGFAGTVPSSLNCYDMETREFVFRHSVFSINGAVKLNPSETELYFTDPGYSTSYESPGTVFIYDSENGGYLGGISLYGYTSGEDAFYPLYANGVIFTPDGNWAYVGTGNSFKISGGIVVIDAKRRKVENIIWPDLGHYIRHMKIGPKL